MDLKSCGMCCGGFSVFSFFFLLIVGGVLNNAAEEAIPIDAAVRASAASACFAGAGLYAGCVGISLICFFYPKVKQMLRGGAELQSLVQAEKQRSRDDNDEIQIV